MRRYTFEYSLELAFSGQASRHTFLLRFVPPSDAAQQVWGFDVRCDPEVTLARSQDAFGNGLLLGHIEGAHDALSFFARGEALLRGGPVAGACPAVYALPTALTQANEALRAMGEGLHGSAADRAMRMAEHIHGRVQYRQGVTSERTTALEALALGAGVCQDLAHLLLACLRAQGMAARYVAGLIPGEGETHAWVEVWAGARFVGIDPTHLRLTDDTYLRVCAGRDSRDCAINRGVFAGGVSQTMRVRARMTERE